MKQHMRSRFGMTFNTAAVVLNTVVMAIALPAAAVGSFDAEQVGSFSEANSAKLVRHHQQLFALVSSDDGLDVYKSNKKGTDWTKLGDNSPVSGNLVSQTAAVTKFGVFKKKLYVGAVNTDGIAQVWGICKNCRPAEWKKSGDAGFGDSGNTSIINFFRVGGNFYAITENVTGNGLFMTGDGESWTQVGSYGFGNSLTNIVAGSRVPVMANAVNVATADGTVYQADKTDLSTWSAIKTFDSEITALRGNFVAVENDGVSTVYQSDEDGNYSQIGETITGSVTQFTRLNLVRVRVLVSHDTAGASYLKLDDNDSTWDTIIDGGFGNTNNTTIASLVRYHGKHYVSTVNTSDGPEVYRLTED